MEELDIAAVTKRSIHGVVALVSRSFFIAVLAFVANFILTIFLSPAVYGVNLVVSAIIAFLVYFSDIGLAGALIQKKEPLTNEELKTTFTIQQIMVVTVSVVALIFSSYIANFYHLHQDGVWLFQALVLSFFLSSLKTIPSVILERDLHFDKLVIPQVVENIFYFSVVVFCAIKGLGVTSFTLAVLARGFSGVIAMYIIQPWKIQIGFSKVTAKQLLSFGIPFQANSFIALLKDDLLIAYIGRVLPLAQVGYIGFAQKWAFAPLRVIMDNIVRITFPSYARLQNDTEHLVKAVEKSLFALALIIFPSLVGLVALAPIFIHIIPKYQKWDPALLSLGFFAINAALSAISTPLTNALNAIGKIKISLYLMIMWTILTWGITPLFIVLFGYNGFAAASAIIATTVVIVIYLTKRYIPFSILHLWVPIVATVIMGAALFLGIRILPQNIFSVITLVIGGATLYLGTTFLLAREEVIKDIVLIKQQFVKN